MGGKGILGCGVVALLLTAPAFAEESAKEIADMLTWWDEFGSNWDEAKEFISMAAATDTVTVQEKPTVLAANTVEGTDGSRAR